MAGFYATCNQTHARVIQYSYGCSAVVQDSTYTLNQCAGGPDEFVVASCGTSGSAPNTSPVPTPSSSPRPSYTPYYYPPITRRATPLSCYFNASSTSITLYNVTDASLMCGRYTFICPRNVTYCTEGSGITVFTSISKDTCQFLMQSPQYRDVICCDTNYCNGPGYSTPNVSGGTAIVPSLALVVMITLFAYLRDIVMQK